MLHISILTIGKTKEQWLQTALATYQKRLQSKLTFHYILCKNDEDLQVKALTHKYLICLDPKGEMFTSERFSDFLDKQIVKSGGRICFVIGGANGLPRDLLNLGAKISLSALTFTHQMARLVLVEQIYRAFEIMKGSSYHK